MRRLTVAAAVCACLAAPALAGQGSAGQTKAKAAPPAKSAKAKAAAPKAGEIVVTATYKGGTVDPAHEILVFLFPNANPDAAPPVAVKPVTSNGGKATFTGVTASPVYIAAVFNEKGDYHGQGGPPPSGTPYTLHADANGAMLPVKADAGAKVALTFDGSRRR